MITDKTVGVTGGADIVFPSGAADTHLSTSSVFGGVHVGQSLVVFCRLFFCDCDYGHHIVYPAAYCFYVCMTPVSVKRRYSMAYHVLILPLINHWYYISKPAFPDFSVTDSNLIISIPTYHRRNHHISLVDQIMQDTI